jgi:predicted lipoprotein with Yx(FWY)xxD motif
MITLRKIRIIALAILIALLMQGLRLLPELDFTRARLSSVLMNVIYGYLFLLPIIFIFWRLYVTFGKPSKASSKINTAAAAAFTLFGLVFIANFLLCQGQCESYFLYPIEQIRALSLGLILPIGNLLSTRNGLLPITLGASALILLHLLSEGIKKEDNKNFMLNQLPSWLSNTIKAKIENVKFQRAIAKLLILLPALSFIGQFFSPSIANGGTLLQSSGPIPFFNDGALFTPYISSNHRTSQNKDNPNLLPGYVYRGAKIDTRDFRSLDCNEDCLSGRRPLLSLRQGRDCTYGPEDQAKWKSLDDIRIHKRCASTPLNVIKRPDGKMQWAFNGNPIYFYPKDDPPAEEGWEKVEMVSFNKEGHFVNLQGMTLYVRDDASLPLNKSRCRGDCLKGMQPFRPDFPFDWDGTAGPRYMFATGGDDRDPDDMTKTQWEINGQFLYLSDRDHKPGDRNAEIASNGYWRTVKPQTPPFKGLVEITKEGKRRLQLALLDSAAPVYMFDRDHNVNTECLGSCLNEFAPYLKSMSRQAWAGPLDQITLKKNSRGQEQWAYQGRLLYISVPELKASPAEVNKSTKRVGLTPIIIDACYAGDEECRKNLAVSTDSIYWSP